MVNPATRSVVLALIGVVAVALAAATLTTAIAPTSGGAIGINGSGEGGLLPPPAADDGPAVLLPIPPAIISLLGIVLAIALVWYVVVYRYEAFRNAVAVAIVVGGIGLILVGLYYFIADAGGSLMGNGSALVGSSGGGGISGGEGNPSAPSLPVLVLIGLLLVGAVAILARGSDMPSMIEGSTEEDTDTESGAADAVGRAAGRAANRIEQASVVDNEVYRAWREMTDLLEVDEPETSTPGEFATAAVAAGMAQDDVDELTRLFEEVRYGGREPTETYERRAVRVFRRIESTYANASDA